MSPDIVWPVGLHRALEDTMRLDIRNTFKSAASSWPHVPDEVHAYVIEEYRLADDVLKKRALYQAINTLRIRFEKSGEDQITVTHQIFVKSSEPQGDFEYKGKFVIETAKRPAPDELCRSIVKALDDGSFKNEMESGAFFQGLRRAK